MCVHQYDWSHGKSIAKLLFQQAAKATNLPLSPSCFSAVILLKNLETCKRRNRRQFALLDFSFCFSSSLFLLSSPPAGQHFQSIFHILRGDISAPPPLENGRKIRRRRRRRRRRGAREKRKRKRKRERRETRDEREKGEREKDSVGHHDIGARW